MTIDEIRDQLRQEPLEVHFRKKDGSIRRMICTTHPDVLGPQQEASRSAAVFQNEIVTVWDLEADAWRSFQFDSIISVSKVSVLWDIETYL
jgi:hypothetical protein